MTLTISVAIYVTFLPASDQLTNQRLNFSFFQPFPSNLTFRLYIHLFFTFPFNVPSLPAVAPVPPVSFPSVPPSPRSSSGPDEAVTSPTSDRAAVARKRFTLQGFSNLRAQKGNCWPPTISVFSPSLRPVIFCMFSV